MGQASRKAFGRVTKLFDDHTALDRVHRGFSDASTMKKLSKLIQTVTFLRKPPSLMKFAIMLSTVADYSPVYHLKQHQCFWFARTICELSMLLFDGDAEIGPAHDTMGTWNNVTFPFFPRNEALKIKYDG